MWRETPCREGVELKFEGAGRLLPESLSGVQILIRQKMTSKERAKKEVTNRVSKKKIKKNGSERPYVENLFVSLGASVKIINLDLLQRAQPNNPQLVV